MNARTTSGRVGLTAVAVVIGGATGAMAAAGPIFAWGDNDDGQVSPCRID